MRGEQLASGVEELDRVWLPELEVAHEEGIAVVDLGLYRLTVRTNQADPGDLRWQRLMVCRSCLVYPKNSKVGARTR